jgi:hypothetical protein
MYRTCDTKFFIFAFVKQYHQPKQHPMKKRIIIALLGLITLGISAQDSGLGAGVIIGEPTGLSGKSWLSSNDAIDAGVAWSITRGWFHLHADYLRHVFGLIPVEQGQLPLYFGGGARVGFGPDVTFAARVPVGLDYLFDGTPLDVFIEIVPGLEIIPDTEFEMSGGVGVRYWF